MTRYSTEYVITSLLFVLHSVNQQRSTTLVFKCKIHLCYWRKMTVEPRAATAQLTVRRLRERAGIALFHRGSNGVLWGLLLHPLALSDILLETTPDRRARRVNKACLHMYLAYRYIDAAQHYETRAQGSPGLQLACALPLFFFWRLWPSSFAAASAAACSRTRERKRSSWDSAFSGMGGSWTRCGSQGTHSSSSSLPPT